MQASRPLAFAECCPRFGCPWLCRVQASARLPLTALSAVLGSEKQMKLHLCIKW